MGARPIHRRLNVRISSGWLTALLVGGASFYVFFYPFHQQQLIEGLRRLSADVSHLILVNLGRRMMEAQPHLLDEDVRQLSASASIQRRALLNPSGEVKVTSDCNLEGLIFTLRESSCCQAQRLLIGMGRTDAPLHLGKLLDPLEMQCAK